MRPFTWRPSFWRPSTRIGLACLVALALSGCGRRGPLELPPGTPQQPAAASASNAAAPSSDKVSVPSSNDKLEQIFHEGSVPRPINAPPAPPEPQKTPFVLDPLL